MAKNKPRWRDLPLYERMAKFAKRNGDSDEMVEYIREKAKEKYGENVKSLIFN